MELAQVLRTAVDAVEAAAVPADLRALAFTKAVDIVVAGQVAPHLPVPARPPADGHALPARPALAAPSAPAVPPERRPAPAAVPPTSLGPGAAIAAALEVPGELVDRLWDLHADEVHLSGDPQRFGRTRAQRVGSAVLLLLAALRWTARDGGSGVPDALVRAEVARLGLLDVGNYSKHLAARRALWATSGTGRTASYRLRHDGLVAARSLARELLGE